MSETYRERIYSRLQNAYYSFRYRLRSVYYGIGNFYRFRRSVYNWRGWDHTYTLELWTESLNELVKYYSNKNNVCQAEKSRKEIVKICKNLHQIVSRLAIEDYTNFKEFNALFNNLKMIPSKELPDGSRICAFTYGKYTKAKFQQLRKKYHKQAENTRNADIDELARILKNDIQKIWD